MLIDTTKGPIDEALLEKREGRDVTEREYLEEVQAISGIVRVPYIMHETAEWVEYWLDGEIVHRSAHVTLLPVPKAQSASSNF